MEVIAMQLYWQAYNGDTTQTIYQGGALEVLRSLPSESVHCCVTSPPYWGLRDYGVEGQIGLEKTPEEYVSKMVEIFREVKRVLRNDGTLWLNLGDCYNGSGGAGGDYNKGGLKEGQPKYPGRKIARLKPKDLVGIPWRVALALQADGWYLRSDIIWHKPNPMPESVKDRPTKAHEYVFLLSKSQKYYYDAEAIKEPIAASTVERAKSKNNASTRKDKGAAQWQSGLTPEQQDKWYSNIDKNTVRNKRSVWTVPTQPFPEAHFAVYPPALITPCILAGCPVGGTVLDPFAGSGTTLLVAQRLGRSGIGIELNPDYCAMASRRIDRGQ
jgi:DNA modification methylase